MMVDRIHKTPCPLRLLFEESKENPYIHIKITGKKYGLTRLDRGQLCLTEDEQPLRFTSLYDDPTYESAYRELLREAEFLKFGQNLSDYLFGLPRLKVQKWFSLFGNTIYLLTETIELPLVGDKEHTVCISSSWEKLHSIATLLRKEAKEYVRYD